jgi:hypothetical protein
MREIRIRGLFALIRQLVWGKTLRNHLQLDLPLKLNAMGTVFGHGFHPLKTRQFWSIPNLQSVHRQGRIPITPAAVAWAEAHVPLAGAKV